MTIQQSSSTSATGLTGMQPLDPQHGKLVKAAEAFEAMMLNEMLKPLKFGAEVDSGGDESAGGAGDTIRGMGTDALGKALASHGGLGVARKIVAEVTREHDAAMAKKGIGKVI